MNDVKNSSNKNIDLLNYADSLRWDLGENLHDSITESIFSDANLIATKSIINEKNKLRTEWEVSLDKIVTSRLLGFPIMFFLLAIVFWLTIQGANYPSGLIAEFLIDKIHPILKSASLSIGIPHFIDGLFIDGAYLAMAWVISVMLPPMAIFFPLFTLLEDFGYLPRVAFNMDKLFQKAGAHGKQALTMSMGFGCNAAGVIAARVIDSPRERLIAIITNNFSLCNGRWPTQILIASIFIGGLVPPNLASLASASAVVGVALLGIFLSLVISWTLSRTVLKGEASAFSLELPPYRPPRILQTLYTSLVDRTIFVLWRAIVFAVPAGMVIWLVANINVNEISLAEYFIVFTDPFALFIGLNGVILLAYIIAIPANEIVIPTILMLTVMSAGIVDAGSGSGVMFELDSVNETGEILKAGGWTVLTGINLMLFSLIHNPCSTTIYTIYKETGSLKWTIFSTIFPVVLGLTVCFLVAQVYRLF
ncbi:MAG: ferrous iron transporter B [Ignavibacteriae bacterium]|nr:ferrous iron transporter B [Ignavibacteriota bacterium]